MKIGRIKITDYLGVKHVDTPFGELNIICGQNGSGKSSIENAVRLAVTGEVSRVTLKKEYGMLVREGTKGAAIELEGEPDAQVAIDKSGKATGIPNPADALTSLVCLLNMPYLSGLNQIELRKTLFNLGGDTGGPDVVLKLLRDGSADMELVEGMKGMLSNFEAAEKHAESKAKEHRALWKGIAGETYGDKKSADWIPDISGESETLQKIAGEYRKRAMESNAAAEDKTKQAKVLDDMKGELAVAKANFTCTECGAINEGDPARAAELDMAVAENATALDVLTRILEQRRQAFEESEVATQKMLTVEADAEKRRDDAQRQHGIIQAWEKIRALLAPDGIPGQLLERVLGQINDRMRSAATATKWGQVVIRPDMAITYGGRLLQLCSESERWRADAMLCEAVAWSTGECFLMFDRFDILGLEQRAVLLTWCDTLVQEGHQIILFGTLKQAPVLEGVNVVWLDGGTTKEAA